MFHISNGSELEKYLATIAVSVLLVVVFLFFRLSRRQKRALRYSIKAKAFFRSLYKTLREFVGESWQFFTGIMFAVIVFAVFTFLSGGMFSHSTTTIADAVTTTSSVHSATRTVIDTSKAWTYDFSTQPNGPIDSKIFNIENGPTKADYNNELETFTNRTANVRVQDGALVLQAQPENRDGKAYTSGRVDTNGSFSFIYGTLTVEAKIPRGVGTWPAAWLMPSNPRYQAADSPSATDQTRIYSLNGELDFLESVGYVPGQNIPASHSYNSLAQTAQYTPAFVSNPYDAYHSYGIVKTATSIEFTLDGQVYARRDKTSGDPLSWPFDQPYYLILNLSLGGSWAGKYGVDDSSAPWQYQIKSITYTPSTVAN
ncbi:MAG: glycoside hydrolase family 16 protein [Candidatus Saccharibacteria bacterium]|nr:glycoside hydrolase family 16 protein [Candidatus Saccharibacteria bacterium]